MKKIEIRVYTRDEVTEFRDRALEKFNENYARRDHLTDFGRFCLDGDKKLVEKYNSWLEHFPNDEEFYIVDGRPANVEITPKYND